MPLSAGERVGPYEILAQIGSGGMGEVYRARDTKLERDVAVKVLPAAVARDPERLARFEREAKVLAALNHPNIAAIYGLEETGNGARAIVMELVEGPTLAERVGSGPIPLDELLKIAAQIADALEAAHDKGIVHRDLKPANVKAPLEGAVKVLDLGLATALPGADRESSDIANSPTLTMGATEMGVILGTAAYMSPEQASGRKVDKRADIWSFGVVLWEMLTGERLFDGGETVSHTLADVLRAQIDFTRLPGTTPAPIRDLVKRCLDRDVKTRLRDIGEARVAIQAWLSNPVGPSSARVGGGNTLPLRTAQVVGAAILLALAAVAFVHFRETPEEPQVLQSTLLPPETAQNVQQFSVSPDGHYLVMRASGPAGTQLWVRALDSLQAKPLAGTEGADFPFWSPDSRWIGFFADQKLKKIPVFGGPPQTLCEARSGQGGAWNRDGVIVFGNFEPPATGLYRVSQDGARAQITKAETGAHRRPVFLPDGRRFLYVAVGPNVPQNGIHLGSLDSKEDRRLLPDASMPAYFDGHLLFVRGQTLMALPVDPKNLEPQGDVFTIGAEQVARGVNPAEFAYTVSAQGTLIYQSGEGGLARRHVWFDRTGKEGDSVGDPVLSRNSAALSPDGKRLVVEHFDRNSGNSDLWTMDLEHGGNESRFTFDASVNTRPVWSPDGSQVAFSSNRGAPAPNLYVRPSNNTGQDQLLFKSNALKFPSDWSRDGRFLIFSHQDSKTGFDILALPLTGQTEEEKKPIPLVQTPFFESQGQLSPDGRWLAYTSTESGNRAEVYVQPLALAPAKSLTGKWQISVAGGSQPRWRNDGKELFYLGPEAKLMAVDIKATAQSFDRGDPKALFQSRVSEVTNSVTNTNFEYVPDSGGKRFLFIVAAGSRSETPAPLTIVVNWLAAVKNQR